MLGKKTPWLLHMVLVIDKGGRDEAPSQQFWLVTSACAGFMLVVDVDPVSL